MAEVRHAVGTEGNGLRPLPAGITIRNQVDDDDPAVVEIMHRAFPEYPKQSIEEYRAFLTTLPPGTRHMRFVAERDGEIIGNVGSLEKFWVEQQGSLIGYVIVRPEHWRHGVGSHLYRKLMEFTAELDAKRLFGNVQEDYPEARQFAERRGFVETGHVLRMSRLNVQQVTFDGYDGLEERLRAEGIEIKTLAELGAKDDAVLRGAHAVDVSTGKDEPSSETFSMPFEQWRDSLMAQPGVSPEAVWVALDGDRYVGLTKVRREGQNAGWHEGMGVEREYRGRGIARLLKLRTVQWARENGVEFLYTGNDVNNPRMFAINSRLGYMPLPNSIEVVKELTPSGR